MPADRPDTRPSAGFTVPTPKVPVPVTPPRGRIISAEKIANEFMGGIVSPKFVRQNFPYKIDLGQSRIGWHERTVVEVLEYAERHKVKVADVKLPDLEKKPDEQQESA